MNDLLDDNSAPLARNDRELTLSTGAILGIFLGLALLCGACFGVGYNMGRRSTPAPLTLADSTTESVPTDTGGTPKPSAGSATETVPVPAPVAPAPKPAPVVRKAPVVAEATPVSPEGTTPPPAAERPAPRAPEVAVKPVSPSALMPGAGSAPGQTGTFMVQIAAVSHQEDADLLLGALRARGYAVSARPSAGDNYIHVQVGPFSNKRDAEAMRQRLIGDGYNPMLKF